MENTNNNISIQDSVLFNHTQTDMDISKYDQGNDTQYGIDRSIFDVDDSVDHINASDYNLSQYLKGSVRD